MIGVPLDVFLPARNAAIVFTYRKQRTMEYKREYAINDLCRKSGILLIRIIHKDAMGHDTCRCITKLDDSDEALSLAISVVFEWLCIDTDINVERDREEIIRYDGKCIEGVCKSVSKADFSLSV